WHALRREVHHVWHVRVPAQRAAHARRRRALAAGARPPVQQPGQIGPQPALALDQRRLLDHAPIDVLERRIALPQPPQPLPPQTSPSRTPPPPPTAPPNNHARCPSSLSPPLSPPAPVPFPPPQPARPGSLSPLLGA